VVKNDGGARSVISGPEPFTCANGVWYNLKVIAFGDSYRFFVDDVEITDLAFIDNSLARALTGGALQIQGKRKFKDPFWFKPTCKHFYFGNVIPYSPDNTHAFHRRILPIDWFVKFEEGDPRRDEGLEKKLSTPEELSKVLNWALEGLLRILNNDGFSDIPSVEERQARWEAKSDPVVAYIYDTKHIYWAVDAFIKIEDFLPALGTYCVKNKLPLWTATRVGLMIRKRFRGEITKTYKWIAEDNMQKNCYCGIGFVEDMDKTQTWMGILFERLQSQQEDAAMEREI
jgi:hypothetical protein